MKIKQADENLFDAVKEITQSTIAAVYPKYYPLGAVEYFKAHHSDENILSDIKDRAVYILFDGDTAAGTVTIKENHIARLFVKKDFQHKGFGKALLDFAEEKISSVYDEVILDASFPAKHIYLKRGYSEKEFCAVETESGDFLCYDVMARKVEK